MASRNGERGAVPRLGYGVEDIYRIGSPEAVSPGKEGVVADRGRRPMASRSSERASWDHEPVASS